MGSLGNKNPAGGTYNHIPRRRFWEGTSLAGRREGVVVPAPKVRSEQWGERGRVGQLPIAALRRPARKMIHRWQTLPLIVVHRC